MRKIAVRKIVRMRRTASVLKRIMLADLTFAIVGLALYMTVLPYDVVVIDAFLWVLEALMSAGVVVTLNVITSRTLYGARYEVLRGESVASLLIALAAVVVSAHLLADEVSEALNGHSLGASHPLSTVYIFAGAAASLLIWHRMKLVGVGSVRILAARTLIKKQLLNAVADAALGTSVLAANAIGTTLIEAVGVVGISAYVLLGYFEIVKEDVMRLIGTYEPVGIKERVSRVVRSVSKLRVRKIVLTALGSFYEVEVWVEAPAETSLIKAYEAALRAARSVVSRVPEVIRALIIVIPSWREGAEHCAGKVKVRAAVVRSDGNSIN